MLANLYNDSCLVPLFWSFAILVLDVNMISSFERRKLFGAFGKLHSFVKYALGVGFLSGISCLLPFWSLDEFSWLKWEKVSQDTSKDNLCWTETCDWTGRVSVL